MLCSTGRPTRIFSTICPSPSYAFLKFSITLAILLEADSNKYSQRSASTHLIGWGACTIILAVSKIRVRGRTLCTLKFFWGLCLYWNDPRYCFNALRRAFVRRLLKLSNNLGIQILRIEAALPGESSEESTASASLSSSPISGASTSTSAMLACRVAWKEVSHQRLITQFSLWPKAENHSNIRK